MTRNPSSADPVGWRQRAALLGPVLLAVAALTQQVAANVTPLNPWKGAGFGMFSTVDRPVWRTIDVTLTVADGRQLKVDIEAFRLDDFSHHLAKRAVETIPVEPFLEQMADLLARTDYVDDGVVAVPAEGESATVEAGDLVAIDLVVTKLGWDAADSVASSEVIAEHRWQRS